MSALMELACQYTWGIFIQQSCREMASTSCALCGRKLCASHQRLHDGIVRCLDCHSRLVTASPLPSAPVSASNNAQQNAPTFEWQKPGWVERTLAQLQDNGTLKPPALLATSSAGLSTEDYAGFAQVEQELASFAPEPGAYS